MRASEFYILRNGETEGPYTKEELQTAAYAGEISDDTLYSYERARKWRPISHLVGRIDPRHVEDNRRKYFIVLDGQVSGPHSYNELERLIRHKQITHESLFSMGDSDPWKPVSQMPLPHIPNDPPPDGIPHESEWQSAAKEQLLGTVDGMNLTVKVGVCWTHEQYYLWQMHTERSSSAGKMYVGGPVSREILRDLLATGNLRRDTRCAKHGEQKWLTVADYV